MKLNKKGFTLIELLATIVILALVMTISITVGVNVYKKAKINSEKVFIRQLAKAISDYAALNYDNFVYENVDHGLVTGLKTGQRFNSGYIPFSELVREKFINESDFKSPYTEKKCSLNSDEKNNFQILYEINGNNDDSDRVRYYFYLSSCISEENMINKNVGFVYNSNSTPR